MRGVWGRVGSTLLMQLLATSDEIVFDRSYPFENRCLANLLHYLAPLAGPPPVPNGWWMDDPDRLWWVDPNSFGFEVTGEPLSYANLGVDRELLHHRAVHGAWRAYSEAVGVPGRYYAEKYGGRSEDLDAAGIGYRTVDLVRDPRDVWASVLAFDAKRGYFGFGRRAEQTEQAYLESFADSLQRRFDQMAVVATGTPTMTVRYEDLVADLPAEGRRLGSWLGVALDERVVETEQASYRHHMTTESVADSVGRWRRDLPAAHVGLIEDRLGGHLDRFGYERLGASNSDVDRS